MAKRAIVWSIQAITVGGPLEETSNIVPSTFENVASTTAGRWFYTGMALAMLSVAVVGFLPSLVQPGARRAPVNLLAAAHGIVFFSWLFIISASESADCQRASRPASQGRHHSEFGAGANGSAWVGNDRRHGATRIRS